MRQLLLGLLFLAVARYFTDLEMDENYKILAMIGLAGFLYLTIYFIRI